MAEKAYVYIVASRSRTLYIGMTTDLERRVHEHTSERVNPTWMDLAETWGTAVAPYRWKRDELIALHVAFAEG